MHCKYLLYFLTRFVRVVCGEHSHAHDEAQTQEHGAQTEDVRYTLVFLHPGHYALVSLARLLVQTRRCWGC